ncbi:MAG: O-sialoglycoprotein endopeptidase [Anaerovoracaceae bacterium]
MNPKKKMNKEYILGIDTSNYKTSVAITDRDKNIICDLRKLLTVKQGERGLRQSDALFQHIETFPALLKEALIGDRNTNICGVAYSDKPRQIPGSYMPVFKAGESFAHTISQALNIPIFSFSHQEGHIEAIKIGSPFEKMDKFLSYHLSGGTCELLKIGQSKINIIGGSKDISFGQVIDRVGVALGMAFPAGEEMDQLALTATKSTKVLKKITVKDTWINLSGIETQCTRASSMEDIDIQGLIRELFDRISDSIVELTENAIQLTCIHNVMFTGGVASSKYIRGKIQLYFEKSSVNIHFGDPKLSQDNGVGIAFLGGDKLWG